MPVYKTKKPSKEGKAWFFSLSYKDSTGKYKKYNSKLFATKKECIEAERNHVLNKNAPITFSKIANEYLALKKPNVKFSSYQK